MISLKACPMYMIRFHIRITLLPTAPSMFQNQKLTKSDIINEKWSFRRKHIFASRTQGPTGVGFRDFKTGPLLGFGCEFEAEKWKLHWGYLILSCPLGLDLNLKMGNEISLDSPQNLVQWIVKGIYSADPPTPKTANDLWILQFAPPPEGDSGNIFHLGLKFDHRGHWRSWPPEK